MGSLDLEPTGSDPGSGFFSPTAGDERSFREWKDELVIEFERLDFSGPRKTVEERNEELERYARASYAEALAEADEAGVDPPEFLVRCATEALTLLDADALADELEKDAEVDVISSAARRICEYVRFERFGSVEARRRRQFAKKVRERALRRRGEHGGYVAARVCVVMDMKQPSRHESRSTRNVRPRGRRRSGRSSRARSPGRESDKPHLLARLGGLRRVSGGRRP